MALGVVSDGLYALAAGTAGGWLKGGGRLLRVERYVTCGGVFVGLGLTAAFAGNGRSSAQRGDNRIVRRSWPPSAAIIGDFVDSDRGSATSCWVAGGGLTLGSFSLATLAVLTAIGLVWATSWRFSSVWRSPGTSRGGVPRRRGRALRYHPGARPAIGRAEEDVMILKTTDRSTYLDLAKMDWEPSGFPGVWNKVLYEDPSGRRTILTRFEPGAELPRHRHVALEQTFILEGSLMDDDGECTAGSFVWRRPGSSPPRLVAERLPRHRDLRAPERVPGRAGPDLGPTAGGRPRGVRGPVPVRAVRRHASAHGHLPRPHPRPAAPLDGRSPSGRSMPSRASRCGSRIDGILDIELPPPPPGGPGVAPLRRST